MPSLFRTDPRLEDEPRVWGPGFFDNDAGVRARDCYLEYILSGRDNADATRLTLEQRCQDTYGSLTDVLVWTALASVQIDLGRLDDGIRDGALELIRDGDCRLLLGYPEWQQERERLLAELAQKLSDGTTAITMDDAGVRDYCHQLWGDDWQRHVDPERPERPNYRT